MQPESISPEWREQGLAAALPTSWRLPLAQLALVWGALVFLTAREWSEMLHQWWDIDTYNHILFVPLIIVWLVSLRRNALSEIEPRNWMPGVALLVTALSLWLAGRITGLNLIAHAGAVAALQAGVVVILGPRVAATIALPLAYMCFLVPFGDELIPTLQMVTADIAIALTHWSGVPATIDGIYIDTPVGLFIVAEACSGVKFLVAMIALGVLVCFTAFERWKKRVLFLAACVIVPILANGVRAWGTIYIAQSQGVEFAEGFDHIFYGWIFFAIIVALVLAVAWRFFEREPEDAGLNAVQVERLARVLRADSYRLRSVAVLAAIGALVLIYMVAAIYAPSGLL